MLLVVFSGLFIVLLGVGFNVIFVSINIVLCIVIGVVLEVVYEFFWLVEFM